MQKQQPIQMIKDQAHSIRLILSYLCICSSNRYEAYILFYFLFRREWYFTKHNGGRTIVRWDWFKNEEK